MQLIAKQVLQSLAMGAILPAVMVSALSGWYQNRDSADPLPQSNTGSYKIKVIDDNGTPEMMDLEYYVRGVLLGEVSTDFNVEALKAQSVAARTYTLYCVQVLGKHTDGAVCSDYRCCQAYCDPDRFLNEGGSVQGLQKVTDAVASTAGQVLNYQSALICATYFASSGGMTEDASEVWGKGYPYLQSVASPGEEDCGYFSQQVRLSPLELQDALGVHLTGRPASWFGMVKYTRGGGIDLVRIGGRLYTGVELRKLLKLRSTIMTFTVTDDTIVIDTKGYGHRVGMSQHGANAMAETGSDYRDILAHYYENTNLRQMID